MIIKVMKNIKRRLFHSLSKKKAIDPDYYNFIVDYQISRDKNTGIFGLDIHKKYGIILWVIPESPAANVGLLPRDYITMIDGIYIKPGDTWYINYLLQRNNVTLSILPTKLIFPNPILSPKLIRKNSNHNNNICIEEIYINTLPITTPGIPIDKIDTYALNNYQSNSEVLMMDRVYI